MNKTVISACLVFAASALPAMAQSEIYPRHFDLDEVELLDGMFKRALDTNVDVLLSYDTDRLLTPFVRQAGLDSGRYAGWLEKHPSFPNWGQPDWSLEGHVGGHYLTALAQTYAATQDSAKKKLLKERIDYIVDVLADCQNAFKSSTDGMKGFIGGQPINQIWTGLYSGDLSEFNRYGGWVPFYCEHKVLAGLRDAWIYAGSTVARDLFRNMSDWAAEVISNLSDEQMQGILGWEHGGMNETLADAYSIFGDKRYLDAAKRYSHAKMIDGMQHDAPAFLDGMHANTQVPKYIGFERISQKDPSAEIYATAARNFWTDVTGRRTVCIGGNSVSEHFLPAKACDRYMSHLEGPETCNTNNMLKLSEMLFDDTSDARYTDFYESALYNHILSTQDPATGGYVYFTSLRPQSYRVYSQVNKGMWCCVGTGMENHSKYGHFIYSRNPDGKTVYVNLFIPSKLKSKDFILTQETEFPYAPSTKITVGKGGKYTIALRHPAWAREGFAVKVNGKPQTVSVAPGEASYVELTRKWKKGDVIELDLPMALRYEECPNLGDYIAFKYGPVLLAARTTASSPEEAAASGLVYEALQNEYGGEGRMDHSPAVVATSKSLSTSPLLIGERKDVLKRIKATGEPLHFTIDAASKESRGGWSELVLEPFYGIHHGRYCCYFYQQTPENYANSGMARADREAAEAVRRTIDYVATGEQQSEAGHKAAYSAGTTSGMFCNEYYRDAPEGGFVSYVLENKNGETEGLSLMLRFINNDSHRKATVYVDGVKLADIAAPGPEIAKDDSGFYNLEFPLPAALLTASDGTVKNEIEVKLSADKGTMIPGLYYLRLLHK